MSANDTSDVRLEEFRLRWFFFRLFLMPPPHFDAFGKIEQFAAHRPPAHHFNKARDLDLLRFAAGAATRFDHRDRLGMQRYQFKPVALPFFDKEEFVIQGGCFDLEAFDVEL